MHNTGYFHLLITSWRSFILSLSFIREFSCLAFSLKRAFQSLSPHFYCPAISPHCRLSLFLLHLALPFFCLLMNSGHPWFTGMADAFTERRRKVGRCENGLQGAVA
jgi:hypothetical protein